MMRRGALLGLAVYFGLMFTLPLAALIGRPPPWPVTGVAFLGLLAFTLLHSAHTWGWRRALAFLGWTFLLTGGMEVLGVHTGWPFGPYVYTSPFLGMSVLGVPVLIPLVWYTVAYPAWHLMDRGWDGRPMHPALRALAASWALTAWDLLADPLMVRRGAWAWLQPGDYFDIPGQNFVGWLWTGWVLFYVWERTRPSRGQDVWPWLTYTGLAVLYVLLALQTGLRGAAVAGGMAMGGLALWSLPGFGLGKTREHEDDHGGRR